MADAHPLLGRLNNALKPILTLDYTHPITESSDGALPLCQILEDLLNNEMKSVALFRSTSGWDYIENLADCLPTESLLKQIRSSVRSGLGRLRAFIRLALNEASFPEYLSALAWNKSLTATYYHDRSLLRDEELVGILLLLFVALKPYKFDLPVTKDLDREDYWTVIVKPFPSPSYQDSDHASLSKSSLPSVSAPSIIQALKPVSHSVDLPPRLNSPQKGSLAAVASPSSHDAYIAGRKRSTRKSKPKVATIGHSAEEVEEREHLTLVNQLASTRQQLLTYEIDLETEKQRRQILQGRFDLLQTEVSRYQKDVSSLQEELDMWKKMVSSSPAASVPGASLPSVDAAASRPQRSLATQISQPQVDSTLLTAQIKEFLETGIIPESYMALIEDDHASSASQPSPTFFDTLNATRQEISELFSFDSLENLIDDYSRSFESIFQSSTTTTTTTK